MLKKLPKRISMILKQRSLPISLNRIMKKAIKNPDFQQSLNTVFML